MPSDRVTTPVADSELLPPPLFSDTPGTWAYDTMSRRIREEILHRTVRDNDAELALRPETRNALSQLDTELHNTATTQITYLRGAPGTSSAPSSELHTWNTLILRPWVTQNATWLSAPWMVTEFYFYRRVAAAFGWCSPDPLCNRIDPFRAQKELGVTSALPAMDAVAARLNHSCRVQSPTSPTPASITHQSNGSSRADDLSTWILASLWGNKMDLSIWPVGDGASQQAQGTMDAVMSSAAEQLLANDVQSVLDHIADATQAGPVHRVDIVIDNAGFELFCDLCLADYLVSAKLADHVYIHMKSHPTFVSDAMHSDLLFLTNALVDSAGHSQTAGLRWESHIQTGAWVLCADDFWVQGSPLWQMPDKLYAEMQESCTVAFLKGDANYRRLLGDLTWDVASTPFSTLARCFPVPLCALRVLKAEVGCGIVASELARAATADPAFFVSGKWGVVQFHADSA